MRRGAGEYRERFVILTRSTAAADATGEEVESWPDPSAGTGEHWGKIEAASGGETTAAPRQSYGTLTVRFRHEITLTAVDRVRHKETAVEYSVSAVWLERAAWGGFQTVCTLVGA